MGRWADAFHARIHARDTTDTADTSPDGPAVPQGSVSSVTTVAPPDDMAGDSSPPRTEPVSTVSPVSHATQTPNADMSRRNRDPVSDLMISDSYMQVTLQRPPSWADQAALPSRGCFCSCCKGQSWWSEWTAPEGWRCTTCHPPDHLPVEATRTLQT